jgi:integrase
MRFSDAEQNTRLPFSDDWIRDRILAPGALDGLNTEARCILLGMVNTGYRPVEGAELRPEDIRLDAEIPHISINGKHRRLKTRHSERLIPLVGVSLDAFRSCPNGFPRYRDSASLTATLNKYLRDHGLRETPDHTLYGFRHSFEDRLLAAGVDERIRRDLMGHKLVDRERYGVGARLQHLSRILAPLAL